MILKNQTEVTFFAEQPKAKIFSDVAIKFTISKIFMIFTEHFHDGCSACSSLSNTSSMLTTTTGYCKMHSPAMLDGIEEQNEGDISNDVEKVEFRKTLLARQLSGDPTKVNPAIPLNEQAKVMVYNPKLEIDRSNFTVGQLLGSGNFGCVYKGNIFHLQKCMSNKLLHVTEQITGSHNLISGEAMGLLHPSSNMKVAIKTVNDPLDGPQRTALLCEMKILSNLDLHLNLVNMMGSCTSDFAVSGELWLLLEFCQHGKKHDAIDLQ